jgi:hypothetical protein
MTATRSNSTLKLTKTSLTLGFRSLTFNRGQTRRRNVSDCLTLPPSVREEAQHWRDQLDAEITSVESAAPRLSEAEANALRNAIADVRANISFARAALSGVVRLTDRPRAHCAIPSKPSPELAAVIHAAGDALGGTPWLMIDRAKLALDDGQRRPFLLVIGTVLASVFTSMTRAVWNKYPEYAPDGWTDEDA